MKAHIEEDFTSGAVRVWLFDRRAEAGEVVLHIYEGGDTGAWRTEIVEAYAQHPRPSFILHSGALEALLEAAQGYAPPEDSARRHLDDTIGVRDRLFDLIEELL